MWISLQEPVWPIEMENFSGVSVRKGAFLTPTESLGAFYLHIRVGDEFWLCYVCHQRQFHSLGFTELFWNNKYIIKLYLSNNLKWLGTCLCITYVRRFD